MDILVDTTVIDVGQIVVDDMHHILDIKSACGNPSCNQDRRLRGTKRAADKQVNQTIQKSSIGLLYSHSILPFTLSPIGMD